MKEKSAKTLYEKEGTRRALELDNRGAIRFDEEGRLDPVILQSYSRNGFFIFEGVIKGEELQDIEQDLADLLDHAPVTKGAKVDHKGRPSFNASCQLEQINWVKPLSDAVGGSTKNHGRHPVKMYEPVPQADAPDFVLQYINGSLQFSEACLRLYGHPQLLAIAEAINGEDFTPFNEGLWIKYPRLGGSVAWHQDGVTHWDKPDLDENTHGFNFMAQLYGCNAGNAVWVVPGSHRLGKIDIKARFEEAGSERLHDAVPLICNPGDVVICNRQILHGSFANTSSDFRVTINFGFHQRQSVLNVPSKEPANPDAVYDATYICERSRLIMFATDARQKQYPEENPFVYKQFAGQEDAYRWSSKVKADLTDYQMYDLRI